MILKEKKDHYKQLKKEIKEIILIPDGIIFGLIDNGILAFTTLVGIDIDKYFKGTGVHGAIYAALIGNSLSDFVGAIVDFPVEVAINITLGCLAIIPLVWLYLFVKRD